MSCKTNCNCESCTKKNDSPGDIIVMKSENITRTFRVVDDLGDPLPDVSFLKAPETERLGVNSSDFERIGITDAEGKISITGPSDMKIVVSHVSGSAIQDTLGGLEENIELQPNQLGEVIITPKTDWPTLITFGSVLLGGALGKLSKLKKPYQIAV